MDKHSRFPASSQHSKDYFEEESSSTTHTDVLQKKDWCDADIPCFLFWLSTLKGLIPSHTFLADDENQSVHGYEALFAGN